MALAPYVVVFVNFYFFKHSYIVYGHQNTTCDIVMHVLVYIQVGPQIVYKQLLLKLVEVEKLITIWKITMIITGND